MLALQRIELAGQRFVILPEIEYERLCREVGEAPDDSDLPEFPKPDQNGNFPALEYSRVAIARNLIRDRKAVGLTQQRLADVTGLRQETISRIESGKHMASVPTIDRIDKAIVAERKKLARKKGK